MVLTPLPLMMVVWALMRWHVLWRVGWQNVLGMTHPTDIVWTATSTLTFPAIVTTVGVMAGMLGLGGGIVLVSVLLLVYVVMGVGGSVSAGKRRGMGGGGSCADIPCHRHHRGSYGGNVGPAHLNVHVCCAMLCCAGTSAGA